MASAVTGHKTAVIHKQRHLILFVLIFNIAFVLILKPVGSSVKDPSDSLVFSKLNCISVSPKNS